MSRSLVTDNLNVVDSFGLNPSEPAAYVQSVSMTLPAESLKAPLTSIYLYVLFPVFFSEDFL